MNEDPLDSLKSFYDQCESATVPTALALPKSRQTIWLRLAVPTFGLACGAAIAIVMATSPSLSSHAEGVQAARAIGQNQVGIGPQVASSKHTKKGTSQWQA